MCIRDSYYTMIDGDFVFGSEVKSFLKYQMCIRDSSKEDRGLRRFLMDLMKIKEDLQICMDELIEKAKFEEGDIFVLGCSTSEVKGKHIGKDTDIEVGKLIVETIKEKLDKINVNFAVQCLSLIHI